MSLLVLMGSGETAPTMVRIHRQVFAAADDGVTDDAPAVLLDTPFGFQLNADGLTERTRAYFAESVGRSVEVARWRNADAPLVERETALALLGRARWAFAGPGSPTYALRQWLGTPVPDALADVARRGGALVLGSAAAVTAGTHAIPVYEIYKSGEEPRWVAGLDVLGALTGIRAAVVPHYDNAEGGSYDTRFCYLGEPRLALLEASLPDDVGVLGVDEHTALLVDVRAGTAAVAGNGRVTVRRRGRSVVVGAGEEVGLSELAGRLRGETLTAVGGAGADTVVGSSDGGGESVEGSSAGGRSAGGSAGGASSGRPSSGGASSRPAAGPAAGGPAGGRVAASLREVAEEQRRRFEAALAARDVQGCIAGVLELEDAIVAWSNDTLQSDDAAAARRVLRSMVVRLGDLATAGARDPRAVVAPYVDLLVHLRQEARRRRDFAVSDLVRDRLATAGVEVRDTADGPEWLLADDG